MAVTDNLKSELTRVIESMSSLPTSAAVAMKFVELGNDIDADPNDYAQVITSDSALSGKILAMANSSWAGVRNRVTSVKTAVNLLGLGTVKTLAVSHCMTGMHDQLKLGAEEASLFWEAALAKAIAAKCWTARFDQKKADEAFAAGLFQDIALTVMFATGRDRYLAQLQNESLSGQGLLDVEQALFGMDHAEVGRLLTQKLQLPDLFVDVVAFHHHQDSLNGAVESESVANAVHASSLLPHLLNAWNTDDASAFRAFVEANLNGCDADAYIGEVQTEFSTVFLRFHEGRQPSADLSELLASTCSDAEPTADVLVHSSAESESPS